MNGAQKCSGRREEADFTAELETPRPHVGGPHTSEAVITWDVPVQLDGRIVESLLTQLRAIGSALNSTNKSSP